MRPTRVVAPVVLACALLLPGAARAVPLALELGGGAWFDHTPQFDFTLRTGVHISGPASLIVRAGLFINTSSSAQLGAQLDAGIRVHLGKMFLEPCGGAWFLFGDANVVRAHAALGIGVNLAKGFSISVEGGWLQPSPLLLGRLSFHF